jgi:hypothetical protein
MFRKRKDKFPIHLEARYLKFMAFMVESAVKAMKNGAEQWIWVLDLAGACGCVCVQGHGGCVLCACATALPPHACAPVSLWPGTTARSAGPCCRAHHQHAPTALHHLRTHPRTQYTRPPTRRR